MTAGNQPVKSAAGWARLNDRPLTARRGHGQHTKAASGPKSKNRRLRAA